MFKISKEFLIALGISLVFIFPFVFAVNGVSHTPDEIIPGTFSGNADSVYIFPGKVGIGTTTLVTEMLEVNGIIKSNSGGFKFPDGSIQTSAASGFNGNIDGNLIVNGKVGIGTTPSEKLHIFSQDIVRFVRRDILDGSKSPRCNCDSGSGSGDETNCAIVFSDDGSANTCYDRYKTDGGAAKSIKYTKETESEAVLKVSSLGNVGINGLSNNYRLYVNGEDFPGLYVATAQQNSYAAYISAPSSSNYGLKVTGYTYINGNFKVNGDTKITGDLEVTGKIKILGDWNDRSVNTVYLASSDGFVCFTCGGDPNNCGLILRTDANDPPTSRRTRSFNYDGSCGPVKKGHYWKVEKSGSGTTSIDWIPLGA